MIISRGIRSLPMLKCSSERWVCAPHSLSAGTSTTPRLSVSFLMAVICFTPVVSLDRLRARGARPSLRSALGGEVDDRLREGLGGFLRQVVADASGEVPVRIFAGELFGVGARRC